MKKEKTIFFSGRLVVTSHIVTIEVYKQECTYFIKLVTTLGDFVEEFYDKDFNNHYLFQSVFQDDPKYQEICGKTSEDEIKINEEKSKMAEENLREKVRRRIEEIKKALP